MSDQQPSEAERYIAANLVALFRFLLNPHLRPMQRRGEVMRTFKPRPNDMIEIVDLKWHRFYVGGARDTVSAAWDPETSTLWYDDTEIARQTIAAWARRIEALIAKETP